MTESQRVEQIMGLPIGIDLRDLDVEPSVLDEAFDWLRWVDATFSTYKYDSEISRSNRGEITLDEVHADVREVLRRCEQLRFETGGYFDIRAPDLPEEARSWDPELSPRAVDPAGLVKGWSIERAARRLSEAGARNFSINAGGDVRVYGSPEEGLQWRIGIQHPRIRDKVAAVVAANELAIATSGAYARGHHIIDPLSQTTPEGVLSVTITGPDLGLADAYATAAYAMGTDGPQWTAGLHGYEALTILANDVVLSTPGFPFAE
jgi:thiamine biosynthesis lipoprotein